MSIAAIEAALIERTRDVLRNTVKEVGSLPAEFSTDMFRTIALRLPGVYWVFGMGATSAAAANTAMIDGRWACVIVTQHARGDKERRIGDATGPGAFDLIDILVPALHGYDVSDAGSLVLIDTQNLYEGEFEKQKIAVYVLVFELPMCWPMQIDERKLDEFRELYGFYDVPPHDSSVQHTKWLAGDESESKPDAKDKITLP